MIQRLLASAAVLAALALATPAGAQTKMRFAHTHPPGDTHHTAALRFAELVKQRTNNQIDIEVHPAGALGNDPGLLQNIRLGALEMGFTGNPFFTAFAPKLNVLDLPFIFADHPHVYRVVDGAVGEKLLAELEQNQIKGLAFWEIGFRNLTNSTRAINAPEDLKGLKLRTTPNPAHVAAFQAFGAIPTPMPFTEVYLALQTKTVDGQENPIGLIHAAKFFEVQRHLSLTNHAYTVSIIAMNLPKFRGLPAAQQKILVDTAREAAQLQRKLNREVEGDALAKMKQAGMQVVEKVDTEPFRKTLGDKITQTYVEKFGRELVDEIAKARN
jgi:TRAP-type transport system periplasmic protein